MCGSMTLAKLFVDMRHRCHWSYSSMSKLHATWNLQTTRLPSWPSRHIVLYAALSWFWRRLHWKVGILNMIFLRASQKDHVSSCILSKATCVRECVLTCSTLLMDLWSMPPSTVVRSSEKYSETMVRLGLSYLSVEWPNKPPQLPGNKLFFAQWSPNRLGIYHSIYIYLCARVCLCYAQ